FLAETLATMGRVAEVAPALALAPAAADGHIRIVGAREHNLRDLSLDLPRDRLIVLTGLSGSGKSSLAFDVLHAEGQRRYVDSLSAYARQFLNVMAKPDLDLLSGLPPTVAIEQRLSRGGRTSTVATVTEIYHYLRLLFAKLGVQHCTGCGEAIRSQTRSQILTRLRRELRGQRVTLLAPVVRGRKGYHKEELAAARLPGLRRHGRDRRPRPRGDPRSGALARGRRAGPVRRGGAAPCEAAPAARARRGRRAARPAGRAPGRASPPPGPGGLRRAAGRAHRPAAGARGRGRSGARRVHRRAPVRGLRRPALEPPRARRPPRGADDRRAHGA